MRPCVLAVEHASPHVRMPRRCCFSQPRSAIWRTCPRDSRSGETECDPWWNSATAKGFGHCTNINECQAACPKEISVEFIPKLNRDFLVSAWGALLK